jgi:hypothetical protein
MAITRTQIKQFVIDNTGKSNKATLVETLCDMALEEAIHRHKWKDASSMRTSTLTTSADATSVALESNTINVKQITWFETADTNNTGNLIIKPIEYIRKNYRTVAEHSSEPPYMAYIMGGTIYFHAPLDKAYSFFVDNTYKPTFASDATECPISYLSNFVAYFVVAQVFLSIEDAQNFGMWMNKAVGRDFDNWLGGAFGRAVQADEGDTALEESMRDMDGMNRKPPLQVEEFVDGASQGTAPWYRPN